MYKHSRVIVMAIAGVLVASLLIGIVAMVIQAF